MLLLCLADIHGDAAGLKAILPEVPPVDLVVVAGDITQLGGKAEALIVLEPFLESGTRIMAVAGNMDRGAAREFLVERQIDIHGRGIIKDGVGFMGLGGGTRSPFATPWELSDEEAATLLAAGHGDVAGAGCIVLVSHAPPRDTEIDCIRTGLHAGSAAVRSFLLSNRVDLCISGHIHEAGGRETDLGGCLCVNVGPFKAERYALIEIGESKPSVTWRNR